MKRMFFIIKNSLQWEFYFNGNIEIKIMRGEKANMSLSSLQRPQTPVLPISEKLRSGNPGQSMQPVADHGGEDLHRHAAVTAAALQWWTPTVARKEEAAIYTFQKLPPIPSALAAHTPRLKLAAGDAELLKVPVPTHVPPSTAGWWSPLQNESHILLSKHWFKSQIRGTCFWS